MNIMNELTRKHLLANKRKTLLSVMAVALSVTMLTAVFTGAESFIASQKNRIYHQTGSHHVLFQEVPLQNADVITKDSNTLAYSFSQSLGYTLVNEIKNPNKPYIYVEAIQPSNNLNRPTTLIDGRYPESANEIVISEHLIESGGLDLHIGDTLTLNLGKRIGISSIVTNELNQFDPYLVLDEETIIDTTETTFQIVGIMKRPTFEFIHAPGYTALTYLDESMFTTVDISVSLNNLAHLYDKALTLAKDSGMKYYQDNTSFNYELLTLGQMNNNRKLITISLLTAFILCLIIATSVFVIHTTFEISLSERRRHLGMMSSVGATKKQLRQSVYFEAFMIGSLAIPLGLVCGMVGIWVTFNGISPILQHFNTFQNTELTFVCSLTSIAFIIIFSTLVLYLSVRKPAKMASAITTIESIRQSPDIKLSHQEVSTSKWTKCLFGFEGELALKNIKRYKRRYHHTIFSLVISIILFLTVSSYLHFSKQAMRIASSDITYDIHLSDDLAKQDDALEFYQTILNLDSITDYSIQQSMMGKITLDSSLLANPEYFNTVKQKDDTYAFTYEIIALDTHSYEVYCQSIGYSPSGLSNKTDVILVNQRQGLVENTYISTPLLNETTELELNLIIQHTYNPKYNQEVPLNIVHYTDTLPMTDVTDKNLSNLLFVIQTDKITELIQTLVEGDYYLHNPSLYLKSDDPYQTQNQISKLETDILGYRIYPENTLKEQQNLEMRNTLLSIFSYGFLALMTLISLVNVFNILTTYIVIRQKEFAMLSSVGLTPKGIRKMLYYESSFYVIKALIYGLPISFIFTLMIHKIYTYSFDLPFSLPWASIFIMLIILTLFIFMTLWYSLSKYKPTHLIESIKCENF